MRVSTEPQLIRWRSQIVIVEDPDRCAVKILVLAASQRP